MPRLLMLYASAGAGHMQAAKALKAVCDTKKDRGSGNSRYA